MQARRHFHLLLHSRERLHIWLSSAHAAAGCDFWGVQGCMGCIGIFRPAHANQFAASFTCETVGCQRLAKTLDCYDLFEHPLGGKKLVGMCRPANASAPKKKFCSSAALFQISSDSRCSAAIDSLAESSPLPAALPSPSFGGPGLKWIFRWKTVIAYHGSDRTSSTTRPCIWPRPRVTLKFVAFF